MTTNESSHLREVQLRYAEFYSAELAEKVIRGMTENALKCKYNGGTVPTGYVIDSEQYYQLDPITAPVVLEIFMMYDKGATMQAIVNEISSRGFRASRGLSKFNMNTVDYMLKNRRYIGEYRYRDIVKPNVDVKTTLYHQYKNYLSCMI